MASVTYGRSISGNHLNRKVEVTLDVYDVLSPAETLLLAKAMVDRALGEPLEKRRHRINKLLRAYMEDADADIEEYSICAQ